MSKEKTVKNSFKDFAQQNGEYYSKVFSLIQRNQLKLYHINFYVSPQENLLIEMALQTKLSYIFND